MARNITFLNGLELPFSVRTLNESFFPAQLCIPRKLLFKYFSLHSLNLFVSCDKKILKNERLKLRTCPPSNSPQILAKLLKGDDFLHFKFRTILQVQVEKSGKQSKRTKAHWRGAEIVSFPWVWYFRICQGVEIKGCNFHSTGVFNWGLLAAQCSLSKLGMY